jgi:hypothetical protein
LLDVVGPDWSHHGSDRRFPRTRVPSRSPVLLMRARVAWLLVAVTAACFAADTALVTSAYPSLLSEEAVAAHGWPLILCAALVGSLMGALIVSRHPRHLVGWLLGFIGVTTSMSLLAETYSRWAAEDQYYYEPVPAWTDFYEPVPAWTGHVAAWISVVLGAPLAVACLTVIFLVVPDGHFLSPRWRYAGVATALGLFAVEAAAFTKSPLHYELDAWGLGQSATKWVTFGNLLIFGALCASVVSMVRRLRRARGDTRQQLRWIAGSAALVAFGLVWLIVAMLRNDGEQTFLASTPLFVAFFLLPIGIAVAVLRYRLYDIDVVIHRTLVYGCLTAVLAGAYLVSVLVLRLAFNPVAGESDLAVAGSTLAAAALFRPARGRIQSGVDRRFYRKRYDAARTLEAFAADCVALDLETLAADLRQVTQDTFQPAHVSLWLRSDQ